MAAGSTPEQYAERGFGRRQEAGRHPALVVVDLNLGFTDPASPLHCETDEAVAANVRLLEAARAAGAPVAFTTLEYDEGGRRVAKAFIDKVPALLTLAPGTRWPRIDDRIAPRPGEPVLVKLFASAFFGTALGALLTAHGCDTVIVTGASTSGCVRATVVDACSHNLRTVVVTDCVGDRAMGPHEANLFDMDTATADVMPLSEVKVAITQRWGCHARPT